MKAEVVMSLNINNDEVVRVNRGTPLIFSINLSNPEASELQAHLESAREEIYQDLAEGRITKEDHDGRIRAVEATQIPAQLVGSDSEPWYKQLKFYYKATEAWKEIDWPIMTLNYPSPTPAGRVLLDADNTASADFGIDPEDTLMLTKASYEVKAALPNHNIESNLVEIVFAQERTSRAEAETVETFLAIGTYYYRRGDHKKALSYAQRVLQTDPKSIPGFVLVGDVENVGGNLKRALFLYEQAYREYLDTPGPKRSPPMGLILRISNLKRHLGMLQ